MQNKKAILIIMDGWGLGQIKKSDAIQNAFTPFVNSLYDQYPHSTLITCGRAVGLPEGQMGNSEVGHLNLGAGRIVYQELERINVAIENGELAKNKCLLDSIEYAKKNNKPLHLMGLVSDGGVHSHIHHLKALTSICHEHDLQEVYIHVFTDGRDTDPKSSIGFLEDLQQHLNKTTGKIADIVGRYYAMDRDRRWERIKVAYDAMVHRKGNITDNLLQAIEKSYADGVTDEFLEPIINTNTPNGNIKNGDAVICFNFRTDRCREITEALTQCAFPDQNMEPLQLDFTTMTMYDHTFKNVRNIFVKDDLKNTIGEILAANNKSQLRIAETEKYPHVTFFFSGGREKPFEGEERIMVPSPKVATYDLQPQMSAPEITRRLLKVINQNKIDFICLNFANADMVGHTGSWKAVTTAVETVDTCVNQVVTTALENDYLVFLTADHGNADFMINEDGSPNTAHTKNLVPYFIIDNEWKGKLKSGKLGDVAPTLLSLMNIKRPKEMTGEILFES